MTVGIDRAVVRESREHDPQYQRVIDRSKRCIGSSVTVIARGRGNIDRAPLANRVPHRRVLKHGAARVDIPTA